MASVLSLSLVEKHYQKLCEILPGGVNSPVRANLAVKNPPLIVERGEKDLLYDIEGKAYIDFCGSWGALIHGHAHPQIIEKITARALKGTSFGAATLLEGEIAYLAAKLVPSLEKLRFVSSGTEATMSAVRLARGYTKKDLIIKYAGNYHGHADFFLIEAGSGVMDLNKASSQGVPEEFIKQTLCLPFNDPIATLQAFKDFGDKIACVIVEPIAGNMGVIPAEKDFLQLLRQLTKKYQALLIFDEVMTGFRVAKGGAQELYQIVPDLTCLGKIIGGGLPAAAFGGKKEIMDYLAPLGPVYQAGTLSGNPLAMEAGLQALLLLNKPNFYERLNLKAENFINTLKKIIKDKNICACVQGVGSMFTLFLGQQEVRNMQEAKKCDQALFASFFSFLFERGIYIPPLQQEAWFISSVHTEKHLEKTLQVIEDFFD